MKLNGRVWKFGSNIGATDLVPAKYDKQGMSHQWDECAKHVLEDLDPGFSSAVQAGDILVAGDNLGAGHAHYHMTAIMGCKTAGLSGLLADSLNALFQRAAIDQGVPAWSFRGLGELVQSGDRLELDLETGMATNLTTGRSAQFKPVSRIILDILDAGGSNNWALIRVGAKPLVH
jgi:3-isopropylmalate/(R)-2-methylmalate dehydratase small subunit